jgi:hypothetical protein
LYEFIPETKETKLLVKFEKTNIEDIAFIQWKLNMLPFYKLGEEYILWRFI